VGDLQLMLVFSIYVSGSCVIWLVDNPSLGSKLVAI